LQVTENNTAGMRGIVFGLCEEGLHIAAKGFGLGQGSGDPFVFDQRDSQVGQKGAAVGGRAAKVVNFVSVTHDMYLNAGGSTGARMKEE
jgi:hypothetical protein